MIEVLWIFTTEARHNRRYVIRQAKDKMHVNDPVGGLGLYSVYVEEHFMNCWHIVEGTMTNGYNTYAGAYENLEERMRQWH